MVLDTARRASPPPRTSRRLVDVAASLAIHAIRTGLDVVVRTTDRTHAGRPIPVVAESMVLDLLTPVPQSIDDELLPGRLTVHRRFRPHVGADGHRPDGAVEPGRRDRPHDGRAHRPRRERRPRHHPHGRNGERVRRTLADRPRDRSRPRPDRPARRGVRRARCRRLRHLRFVRVGVDRHAGAAGTGRRSPGSAAGSPCSVLGAVVAVAAATAIAVVSVGGSLADFGAAFSAGPQRLLSTEWPSPVRGDLVGHRRRRLVGHGGGSRPAGHGAAVASVAVVAGGDHLRRRRGAVVAARRAPAGARRVVRDLHRCSPRCAPTARFRDRWLPPAAASDGCSGSSPSPASLAFAVSIPTSFATRADPRRDDPGPGHGRTARPDRSNHRAADARPPDRPARDHRNRRHASELPARWRTAALEEYDGRRWTPVLTIRPIGSTLGPVTGRDDQRRHHVPRRRPQPRAVPGNTGQRRRAGGDRS